MGGLSSQSGVKSVQRGQVYATGTSNPNVAPEIRALDITISAVNLSKARVVVDVVNGWESTGSAQATADTNAHTADFTGTTAGALRKSFGYLLNATTLRIYAGGTTVGSIRFTGRWEVIEDN